MRITTFLLLLLPAFTLAQAPEQLITNVLADPTPSEVQQALHWARQKQLDPKNVKREDSMVLSNGNTLYIVSHEVEGNRHYGAVVVPPTIHLRKIPVVIMATGGDGIHNEFNITTDFNHGKVQFPSLLGERTDSQVIVVIPSFRGQQLITKDKKYLSTGMVSDAFDGATTDALALLNVVLKTWDNADHKKIAIYGGSRGGTVALLAAVRDPRISRVVAVAAPTDMKALYQLYPEQFKLLFFKDLLSAKITPHMARMKFIASSPIYFTAQLCAVQIHHDEGDPFVPLSFAKNFENVMKNDNKKVEAYYYNQGMHGYWPDETFTRRVNEFLQW